jgi:hypothetical protein
MSSSSETGHAKNLSNFLQLIANCKTLGTSYNPARKELSIAGLETIARNAKEALEQLNAAKTRYNNATNEREILFAALPKLSTRLLSSLAAFGVSDLTLKDAKTIHRKVQGAKAPATIAANEEKKQSLPDKETVSIGHSSAQLSYDSRAAHFAKWYALLQQQPAYTPNEKELTVSHIGMLVEQLQERTKKAVEAATEWSDARIHRDKILYEPGNGLLDIAGDTKKYIKAIFGTKNPEYKQVSSISFKK